MAAAASPDFAASASSAWASRANVCSRHSQPSSWTARGSPCVPTPSTGTTTAGSPRKFATPAYFCPAQQQRCARKSRHDECFSADKVCDAKDAAAMRGGCGSVAESATCTFEGPIQVRPIHVQTLRPRWSVDSPLCSWSKNGRSGAQSGRLDLETSRPAVNERIGAVRMVVSDDRDIVAEHDSV